MSAVAWFIMIPKDAAPVLRAVAKQPAHVEDPYFGFLKHNGRQVADYEWPGYALATLLPYLEEEHGIRLMGSEYDELGSFLTEAKGASHFVLTARHRDAYLAALSPDSFDDGALCEYYNEFNATDDPAAGEMMKDGIRAIRDSLAALDDSSVVLLVIG